ncbi:MAG TPA: cyclic nucleotide-binding domain-containing protein [Spirochaetia bacterium]|nr:cyclic nucleotide-binding domain-containing protein [Spirochaetia bacterium]
MSPKAVFYKANSVIYFKGDESDKVFILNSGRLSLNYEDIETGQEIHDLVKVGEFFGVKSALGRYRREETAIVLTDCQVVAFSAEEFEQLVLKNIPLIVKMLKVFSNQLRRIQKQVQTLLGAEEHANEEKGLFSIGEYYLRHNTYSQAIYAFKRYLVYYPSGPNAKEALKNIEVAEAALQKYGPGKGPTAPPPGPAAGAGQPVSKPQAAQAVSGSEQRYYRAVSLISQEKYEEALKVLTSIANETADEEYRSKAQYESGRCLFYLKQYDKAINLFTGWIQKYPKHPDMRDALYFVGTAYYNMKDRTKAAAILKKILSMTPESETLYQKARKLLKQIEGAL